MIMSIISCIFAVLGILGFYFGNITLTYIGAIIGVIENIIAFSIGEQKGFSTLIIAGIIAYFISFNSIPFIIALSICICFENVICFVLGLILFGIIMGIQLKN